VTGFPLPGMSKAAVVAAAPGAGPGYWAGGSCAVLDEDGTFVLAYRVRNGHDGIDQNVIARSLDGESFRTVAVLDQHRFNAQWVERPALLRTPDGRWRLWVCCGSPETKRWWIDVVEADTLAGLTEAEVRPAFRGDDLNAVKDPLIRYAGGRYHAWICCHLLDIPGEEDRMNTAYATSVDGWSWDWHGTVLAGRPGEWDARGARITSVLPDGRACFDGRASAAENWFERTAIAEPAPGGTFTQLADSPVVDVRYLDVLALPGGDYRIYYEARLPDESHELRTEIIPAAVLD
jgi:hypothetical protein